MFAVRVITDGKLMGTITASDGGKLIFEGEKEELVKLCEMYAEQLGEDEEVPDDEITAEMIVRRIAERVNGTRTWAEVVTD